jgi:hypothetical protein
MFLGSTARPARKADNLTAICEPVGILNIPRNLHGLLHGKLLQFYLYVIHSLWNAGLGSRKASAYKQDNTE